MVGKRSKRRVILLLALSGVGCQTGKMVPASSRLPEGFEKPRGALVPVETRAAGSNGVPQIFTKSTKIEVKPVERHGGDGSLFRLDDGRNGLFTTEEPTVPGSYLTVEVASNHAPAWS